MKKLFEAVYEELKKKVGSYISLSLNPTEPTRYSFYIDIEENLTETEGEEWGNRTKIPIKTYPTLMADEELIKKDLQIEILDIFLPTEFRVVFSQQQIYSQSKEEWVEFAMKEMGKEIDRLCGKWVKKRSSTSPSSLAIAYRLSTRQRLVMSIDVIGTNISLMCFPNEEVSVGRKYDTDTLFLYQLRKLSKGETQAITISPLLNARLRQIKEKFDRTEVDLGLMLTDLKIVDKPYTIGNYLPGIS